MEHSILEKQVWVSKTYPDRSVTVSAIKKDRHGREQVYYHAPPLAPGCADFLTCCETAKFLEVFRLKEAKNA